MKPGITETSEESVIRSLNASDLAELRACRQRGYVTPRCNPKNGKMLTSQWRSWNRLQNFGCGEIEGMGEADDFAINDFGRQVLKSC
jgi:hypothetical protein